jgi:hypothetical protein
LISLEQQHFVKTLYSRVRRQGCQFFLDTLYQSGKNIPNYQEIAKIAINIPNGHKIYQMAIKILHFQFQGPPKFTQIEILVGKYTIWQPCPVPIPVREFMADLHKPLLTQSLGDGVIASASRQKILGSNPARRKVLGIYTLQCCCL